MRPESQPFVPIMAEETVPTAVLPMNLLVVDDEQHVRQLCVDVAVQSGMKVTAVATAEEALAVLEYSIVDILITDLKLPQSSGLDLLQRIHDSHPEVAVIVLTQYGTIDSAVTATRLGAMDYVTKPFRLEELRTRLERVAKAVELQQENRLLREQLRTRPGFGGLIGVSAKMQRIYKMIEKVSQDDFQFQVQDKPNGEHSGRMATLGADVNALAAYAPIVVVGQANWEPGLQDLIASGQADYVPRGEGCITIAAGLLERRLAQVRRAVAGVSPITGDWEKDFAEVLRHELNNPLTGILGNAELLLAEISRRKDGQLPSGGLQRVETIAVLAVRMRETVRQLSQEWEARSEAVRSA